MTVPQEYLRASEDFDELILDVRDTCMLPTRHQAYHTLRAVLHVFRSHLTVEDALVFANILPPVTRAIFVEDWVIGDSRRAFPTRDELQREVKAIRPDHNLAPESAISDVARALRCSSIDAAALVRVPKLPPEGASEFWAVST